jgi:glycosyltransferase involved in cell wall biosynthesis
MKILLFNLRTDARDTALGFTTPLINALARRCQRVYVVTMYVGKVDVAPNVTVFSLGGERGYSKLRRLLRFYRIVFMVTKRVRIDVCFAHMTQLLAILFWPIAKVKRIPILLWYAHGNVPLELRIAHKLVDRCVTSTPAGFRIKSAKLSILHQGIDTSVFFPPVEAPPDYERTAISVGRITAIKRTLEVVETIAALRKSGVEMRLVLVGEPVTAADRSYQEQMVAKIESLGLNGCVTFEGAVSFEQIAAHYRKGGFLLNLSKSGSLDKAILEGMASGCIPISRQAFTTLARAHGLDQLVPHSGPEGAAACLREAIGLSEHEKTMLRARLREIVVREHSLDLLAHDIVEHLREISRVSAAHPS